MDTAFQFHNGFEQSDPKKLIEDQIKSFYRLEESQVVNYVLPFAEVNPGARSRAWDKARRMVLKIRRDKEGHGGVDALLNQYSMSTEEGAVLMCLAEALLRVPDKKTQEELIQDKLTQGKWANYIGSSESLFVNASSWGLLISGNIVRFQKRDYRDNVSLLKRTVSRFGEPVIRTAMNIAMKIMGNQFVMGKNIATAIHRAVKEEQKGYIYSYDMLGEGARTELDAQKYFQAYVGAIHAIGSSASAQSHKGPFVSPGISVKLSAIYPRFEFTHQSQAIARILPQLLELCLLAKQYDMGLTVDAEESDRLELTLIIFEKVFIDPRLENWCGLGLAVQSYQKRSIFIIDWLKALAEQHKRKIMVRLVKGAYWDTEIKDSQLRGLEEYPVFTRKSSTDVAYHACANKLLDYRQWLYPQFATHNAYTASVIIELAGKDPKGFEFQRLHGMGEELYDQILDEERVRCRVYAPVGEHDALLAYLVRRLLENGANSSFVNAILDEQKPVEELLDDPVEKTQRLTTLRNHNIPLPVDLFTPQRQNSLGIDISDTRSLDAFNLFLQQWCRQYVKEKKIDPLDLSDQGAGMVVINPANTQECLGHLKFFDEEEIRQQLQAAQQAFDSWSRLPCEDRTSILTRISDALERHRNELVALCMKEAGKTLQDSIDEVREAVDFCRYYAQEALAISLDTRLQPRGVVLCISPWNFPLAIFTGQVVAALVVGNTVLAKPAEQTSLVAQKTVEIMHQVGLPNDVLQCVCGEGPKVGNALLHQETIKAVLFTGSTQTGNFIAQALAKRGGEQVPLIAETGGLNCMIVDSTALPEQVVDDVIMSGFKSAGQRCSALRVLFLQEEVADNITSMIIGAMKTLVLGDPAALDTDVGPVIDIKALNRLHEHVIALDKNLGAKKLYACELSAELKASGFYFPPHLFQIIDINVLNEEVFGPCVHIIRYHANDLEKMIETINSTGFGLTFGIHSRIEERVQWLANIIRVGNVYINRNMVGAVVGVQPFGGRGLSGTGPKAGGPNYLSRLMIEKATPNPKEVNDTVVELDSDKALCGDEQSDREASELMLNAQAVEKTWRLTSLNTRTSLVRQLLAKIATVDIVEEMAEDLNATLATARAQLINIEKKLKKPLLLPGPTGEMNLLYYEPRGILVCFADKNVTFEYWTMSIVSALALGNTVISVVSDFFYDEAMAFVKKFAQLESPDNVLQVARLRHMEALLMNDQLAGVVIDSKSERSSYLSSQLANRSGAILPVITAEYNDNLIQRLLVEKVVSINTTAFGGNRYLLSLEED